MKKISFILTVILTVMMFTTSCGKDYKAEPAPTVYMADSKIESDNSIAIENPAYYEPDYIDTTETYNEVNEFTYEEAQALLKIAQAEAGNQGCDGMWLVMSVVLNRQMSDTFPDTIQEVINQPHQFSTVTNGTYTSAKPCTECHEALALIEQGMVAPQIIGFETKDSKKLNKYFEEKYTFRNHTFYEER